MPLSSQKVLFSSSHACVPEVGNWQSAIGRALTQQCRPVKQRQHVAAQTCLCMLSNAH